MDPYLWLEEVEGEKALEFVKAANQKTQDLYYQKPGFHRFKNEIQVILESDEKGFVGGSVHNGFIYDFTRTREHPKGLFRRCELAKLNEKKWEVLIDFKEVEEPWTLYDFKFIKMPREAPKRLFIYLSFGGKDQRWIREFDLETKSWVDRFQFPICKGYAELISDTEVIYCAGEVTAAGYPSEIFYLKENQKEEAKQIFKIPAHWTMVYPVISIDQKSNEKITTIRARVDFYRESVYVVKEDLSLELLIENLKIAVVGLCRGRLLIFSAADQSELKKDHLYFFDLKKKSWSELPSLPEGTYLQNGSLSQGQIFASVTENVREQIYYLNDQNEWIKASADGLKSWTVFAVDMATDQIYFQAHSFTEPDQIFLFSPSGLKPVYQGKSFFNAEGLVTRQEFATSKDGTKIPYSVIGKTTGAATPTIINAYGGFYLSRFPTYLSVTGKAWLEKGGRFVIANIRGGAEYGSDWHDQVIKENRMKCFEDLATVAEDLVRRDYAKKEQVAIYGGSNGGLLVSATAVHFPEVCQAVVCTVPLIDMERYHLLLAGISWAAEYGTVEDSLEMKAAIEAYNPFRQVRSDVQYPKILFQTSTYDDRVHPGHARRMYARMASQGHQVFYQEAMQGGHGSKVTPAQQAEEKALMWIFLAEELGLDI